MGDAERTIKLNLREIRGSVSRRPVLVAIQGQGLGMTIQLTKERTVIGRGSAADLVLRDDVSSRQHAMISRMCTQEGCVEYYVTDLGSTNGTYLNGAKVVDEQLLQDGDKIKIGEHMLKFALLDEFEAEFQERLHQMIQRDELTGLRSRRSLFADLDREIERAALLEDPPPISMVMMDLDFFKRVNDGHGHLVGSQTIREVGHIIRDIIGSADKAARYGGEEFLAYVRGTHQEGLKVAETIRAAVEAYPFSSSTTDLSQLMTVTISLGVATFPKDGMKALDIVQKADQALYRAKLAGRNRTCAYDPRVDKPGASFLGVDASAIIYGPADAQ
ncbi:MAG TPA: GGDEF domain-containing protein [Blastocatellia bacterium]|nr:GGDEF domain-containing protein [Blastocatellia bacterium]